MSRRAAPKAMTAARRAEVSSSCRRAAPKAMSAAHGAGVSP